MARAAAALLAVAALSTGCGGSSEDPDPATPVRTTTSTPAATTVPSTAESTVTWADPVDGRRRLVGFDEVLVTLTAVDGTTCQACLLHATTGAQHERGLMFVTDPDLGGYDGMLFSFERPVQGGFWMRHTRLALSGVFFGEDGTAVGVQHMEPCRDETPDADCPRYDPGAPFRWVIELAGRAPADLGLAPGARLTVESGPCPLELAGRGR